jgi:2-oxoglutarate ferredoxin oxidoreductase subunit delta
MKLHIFNNRHTQTPFVQLNTRKCKACWKCIDSCNKKVIRKVNFPGHKHARISNADKCAGCLKCLKVCEYGAYTKIEEAYRDKDNIKPTS